MPKYGLKHVPVHFHGKAKDLFLNLVVKHGKSDLINSIFDENWHDLFLEFLSKEYLESKCKYCNNDVWAEGIVLSKHGLSFEPYKLKAFNFIQQEQEDVEKGEVNMEDENN